MKRIAVFLALCALAAQCGAQVFRAEPQRGERPQSSSGELNTPPAQKPPFAAERRRNGKGERCRNFDRELQALARRSAEAKSTGERDQFDLEYQRLQESRGRAGC